MIYCKLYNISIGSKKLSEQINNNSEQVKAISSIITDIKEDNYVKNNGKPLHNTRSFISRGCLTGNNEIFIISAAKAQAFYDKKETYSKIILPCVTGNDLDKYKLNTPIDKYIIDINTLFPKSYNSYEELQDSFPEIYQYLAKFKDILIKRDNAPYWMHLSRIPNYNEILKPKIITQRLSITPKFCIDNTGYTCLDTAIYIVIDNMEYLTLMFNSTYYIEFLKSSFYYPNMSAVKLSIDGLRSIPIIIPEEPILTEFKNTYLELMSLLSSNKDISKLEEDINKKIKQLYEDYARL